MRLDFSEIKENVPFEEGEHVVDIIGAKEDTSKNGTHMLVIDMKDVNGSFVRDNLCLEGAGAFKARQFFKALSLQEDEVAEMEASDLIGMSVGIEIVLEDFEGTTRSKVKKYFAA